MKGKGLFILIVIAGIVTVGYRWLPSQYNPFVPLTLDDPPGKITQFKLRRLTPQACESLLTQANQRRLIRTQAVADSAGECPLSNVVRVRDFGPVSLNSSFLASCPLALSSALFVSQQARPLTKTWTGSELARIEHLPQYLQPPGCAAQRTCHGGCAGYQRFQAGKRTACYRSKRLESGKDAALATGAALGKLWLLR